MAEVTVTIAGRPYRMACDDGQEGHLRALAAIVDEKMSAMRGSFGEVGDMRLAVMSAIVVADELTEARRRIQELEGDIEALKNRDRDDDAERLAAENDAARRVEELAERLENLAADMISQARRAEGAGGTANAALD